MLKLKTCFMEINVESCQLLLPSWYFFPEEVGPIPLIAVHKMSSFETRAGLLHPPRHPRSCETKNILSEHLSPRAFYSSLISQPLIAHVEMRSKRNQLALEIAWKISGCRIDHLCYSQWSRILVWKSTFLWAGNSKLSKMMARKCVFLEDYRPSSNTAFVKCDWLHVWTAAQSL